MHEMTRLHLLEPLPSKKGRPARKRPTALQTALEMVDELQADHIMLLAKNEDLRSTLYASEESQDRYRNFYENSPVGYLTLDQDLLVVDINPAALTMLTTDRDKILASSLCRFITAWDVERFRRHARKALKAPGKQTLDVSLHRENGSLFFAQFDCVRMMQKDLLPTLQVTLIDITERKKSEAEIKKLAFHDFLTTLPNRRLLLDRLQHGLARCSRTRQHGAIFYIDLDDFKMLNDTYGHALGDVLLQQVAHRLTSCVRECDTVARLGGDEFVVVIQDLNRDAAKAAREVEKLGAKLLTALSQPYLLAGHQYTTCGCAGVTMFPDDQFPVEELLKQADLALYSAKTMGRNQIQFFTPEMQAIVLARGVLDAEMRQSLKKKDFLLHYQPQVNHEGRTTSAEALLRWQHPHLGLLLPSDFVPYAEEKGLIGLLGEQVLESACKQLKTWSTMPQMEHLKIAINISAHEFSHPNFVGRMLGVLDRDGVDPKKLILEFTERVMFNSVDETLEKMKALKRRGICFSLDDFGIGYSSLSYLHSLPLDQLKIDRSFVRDVTTNPNDAAITRSIIALGQSLNLEVLAEGVETEEQRAFLAKHGCCAYQGYLFGEPAPPEALALTM
jgi:diguanylate cyclase (GGDEF)-like protein/PAS domain S-box-containing protein